MFIHVPRFSYSTIIGEIETQHKRILLQIGAMSYRRRRPFGFLRQRYRNIFILTQIHIIIKALQERTNPDNIPQNIFFKMHSYGGSVTDLYNYTSQSKTSLTLFSLVSERNILLECPITSSPADVVVLTWCRWIYQNLLFYQISLNKWGPSFSKT